MALHLSGTETWHNLQCQSQVHQKHASHKQCLMRPLWDRRVAHISGLYHKNSGALLKYSCTNRVKIDVIIQYTVTQSTLEAILHHSNAFNTKALIVSTWRLLELSSRLCAYAGPENKGEPLARDTGKWQEVCGSGIFAHTDLQHLLTSTNHKHRKQWHFWDTLESVLVHYKEVHLLQVRGSTLTISGSPESYQLLSFSHLRLEGRQQNGGLQWSNLGLVEMQYVVKM